MKSVFMIVTALAIALAVTVGCQKSPQGGNKVDEVGFRLAGPYLATEVRQGELQTVYVKVDRGDHFHQDVTLAVEAPRGIDVTPRKAVVTDEEHPEVQLRVAADKEAKPGEYAVILHGKAETGDPTALVMTVRVIE